VDIELKSDSPPMQSRFDNRVLVVGVGNIDRGDDGVGIITARHVQARELPDVQVVEQSGDCAGLIGLWQTIQTGTVYLVDAMSSGIPAGSIQYFDAHKEPLPSYLSVNSTHAFGVARAVELARVLGYLPERLLVYGIEGRCFEPGAPLSAQVSDATRTVANMIVVSVQARQEPYRG
jgi:hydrogenase maturation protease